MANRGSLDEMGDNMVHLVELPIAKQTGVVLTRGSLVEMGDNKVNLVELTAIRVFRV